ncbi:MAG: polyphosphate kinase 1 [Lawsonibacter sp.]|nr:polyphosphate kinase 1 [Lawsonibacter sp.]
MKEQSAAWTPNGCYVNRELSWLLFNRRVLEEAEDLANPLCERMNFASIFQSNLDEFYMVRVGMLMDTLHLSATDDKTGMTSAEQTAAVLDMTRELLADRDRVCRSLMGELAGQGVELCRFSSLQDKTQSFLEKQFTSNILPLLSPQIIGRKQPFPFLRNKAIYAVAILRTKSGGERMGIVPCGEGVLHRLVPLPGEGQRFVLVEELIAGFLPKIFAHYKVEGTVLIRLVRSADIHMDDASSEMSDMLAEEYRRSMEKMIRRRKRLQPVKLEYQGKLSDTVRDGLCSCLGLSKKHFFASEAPLDLSFMSALRDILREKSGLFYPRRVPQNSPNVEALVPMAEQIRERDLMLNYPYENVRPLLRLLQEAGQDPEVVSIKMTLYRVAHNSKIVEALVDAAENGKEVVALVELRARFDEENNIGWSRVLEQAGCRVIYGLDGLKVHSKLLLITRMHNNQVEYITQVGTGNYNEDTVRLYTDYALMTASPEIGAEAAQIFNALSMGEVVEDSRHLMVAPACLRSKVLAFIDREIELARAGEEAYLGFKLNGLTDKLIIDKLIEASQAGVEIDLVVRGICCLVGGVPGMTERIRVRSIVGRYLEHARIYIFGLGERKRVYISSADFMTRNTTRRVEVAVPVYDGALQKHLEEMFRSQLQDTAKGRIQQPDGSYVRAQGELFNTQEHFCDQAYAGAWALEKPGERPKSGAKTAARTAAKSAQARLEAKPAQAKPAVQKSAAAVRKTRRGLWGRLVKRDM